MIKIKYNISEEEITAVFRRVTDNIVRANPGIQSTDGFLTYTVDDKPLGDFSDYTTIYLVNGDEVYYSNNGEVAPEPEPVKPITQEEIQKKLTDAVQNYMDEVAKQKNYDNILSACSYVDTGDSEFDNDGILARKWRSAVWRTYYTVLADVLSGERGIPNENELRNVILPRLNWNTGEITYYSESESEDTSENNVVIEKGE